jgi:hypothetical protein
MANAKTEKTKPHVLKIVKQLRYVETVNAKTGKMLPVVRKIAIIIRYAEMVFVKQARTQQAARLTAEQALL